MGTWRRRAYAFALLAIGSVVFAARDAHADFLVLRDGETHRGTLETCDDGSLTTTESEYSYDPEQVAFTSTAETVEEVVASWAGMVGACETADARASCLSLAKFCVTQGRYEDAEKYFGLWGKSKGWEVRNSKYYFILSNAKTKRMKELGQRLDAIVRFYQQEFGEKVEAKQDFMVRFFKTEGAFEAFAQKAGVGQAGAYFDPTLRELVLWDMSLTNKNFTFEAVYHEANHQFVETYFLRHQPKHAWFSEGMATYYETAKYKRKRIVECGKKSIEYLANLRRGIRAGRLTPLETFLSMEHRAFYCGGDQETLNYAQAWGLVYFFKNTKDEECRAFFDRYIEVLRETKDDAKALAAALEEASCEEVAKAFEAFKKKL